MITLSKLRILVAAAAASLAALGALAQTDAQYTQYWHAPAYYNPSAIGLTDFIHITAGSRMQWVGVDHAPVSFLGMADMPFKLLGKRWGTGVVVQQESMGLYSSLNAGAQIAFKKQKLLGGTLSVGVQVGMLNETFKGSKVVIPEGDDAHNSNDDAIPTTDVTGTAFDVSAGIHYTHKWFWLGISATHLTQPSVTLKADGTDDKQYEFNAGRTYYLMAGSNIPIKNTLFELQPSFLVKTDTRFFQGEVTARVRYNKFLSGGVAYRYGDAVSAMVGVELKNFFVGYSYDYPISKMSVGTTGSHEVMVSYNVKLDLSEKNKNKHKSIRIM